jgi:hypothetical protein
VSVTAYHSFGGEVGSFEHPHDTERVNDFETAHCRI